MIFISVSMAELIAPANMVYQKENSRFQTLNIKISTCKCLQTAIVLIFVV
jgi:hypothetical protein